VTNSRTARRARRGLAAIAAGGLALAAAIAPASASGRHHQHGPSVSSPIATNIAGPLQMSVARNGDVWVAQDFAGILTRVFRNGTKTNVASNPGGELAGVDLGKRGIFYTTTNSDSSGATTAAALRRIQHGHDTQVADIFAYEKANNPDQGVTYGFDPPLPASCASQWPPSGGSGPDSVPPPTYTGIVDTHPFSVAVSGRHTYIGDAAGNDILDVTGNGHIRLVTVMPRQPLVLTAAQLTANHLPTCAAGMTYYFEPVPTDVEIGPHGWLYVTTLPGGPEDPSLGARGSVYVVNPHNGHFWRLATGFAGATNLAVGPHGRVYVSELFGNQVSTVWNGQPKKLVGINQPAALEYARGRLYVGYDALDQSGNGKIATISLGRSGH
jgi:hypothetical protein